MTEQTYTEANLIRDLTAIRNDLKSCDGGAFAKSVIESAAVNAAHDLDHVLNNLGAPEVNLSSQRTVSLGAYDGDVTERTLSYHAAEWKQVRNDRFDAVDDAIGDNKGRDEVLRLVAEYGSAAFAEGAWATRRSSPPPPSADLVLCDDGGYVPSDDSDPAKLAAFINVRLHNLRYYDGETALDGPYLMTAFRPWYDNVIYSPCGDEAQGAHVNALLHWNTQTGDVVSDLLPPYPGRNIGWRWGSIMLGSQWVVSAWLTNGAVAVQAQ